MSKSQTQDSKDPTKEESNKKSSTPNWQANPALKYTSIASKMAAIILAGVFGGKYLDEASGNTETPIWTLILSIISVFMAIYVVIKDLMR